MNAEIDTLHTLCQQARTILLTGPVFPDGDSIGACLALRTAIQQISNANVDITGKITFRYQWMSGISDFKEDKDLLEHYDLAIVLDGDRYRLPPLVERAYNNANHCALIDHHASTDSSVYSLALLDVHSASTCQMILTILDRWKLELTKEIAEMIYTGLIFDTGGFRHPNTTVAVHNIAARLLATGIDHSTIFSTVLVERKSSGLQLLADTIANHKYLANGEIILASIDLATMNRLKCTQGDIEGIIDMLVFTQGVELACLCIERSEQQVKLSLRSRKTVNVATLAKKIHADGGGHIRAAGAIVPENLTSLMQRLPTLLCQTLTE